MNKIFSQQHTSRGAALLLFVIFFMFASASLTFLISKSIYADLVSHRILLDSKQSFITAESSLEDVTYRYINPSLEVDTTETLILAGASASTETTVDTPNNQLLLDAVGTNNGAVRKVTIGLTIASGASFNFGVQTGNGGFNMTNSAKVIGNVFSNGNITGAGSSVIEGDVIAAGPGGTVDGVSATGSIRADIIKNSTIGLDSFYGTTFTNNSYTNTPNGPGWPNEATSTLPFPDSKVDEHKATVTAEIAAGNGILIASTSPECASPPYVINTSTTTGIIKIECNVLVDKSATTWTVQDTVWISGNLTFKSGPTIQATPAVSTTSILMIVDNESNRLTSSKIIVQNGTIFSAPSSPKSYIMLLSMNDSAENSGSETAIDMGQSSNGDVIIYSGHGKIALANMITLKEVTGYLISMGNNSTIEYESGLINLNFSSGPGGGFSINSWHEVE